MSGQDEGLTASEKFKKRKEIQSRYSHLTKMKTATSFKESRNTLKSGGKTALNMTTVTDVTDAETQTQFSKTKDESTINELKQDIQDMRNEYEVKESHLKLELTMLKSKLEEQVQINLGTKKILALENKSLDLLTKRIDRFIEACNNDNDEEDGSIKDDMSDSHITKSATKDSDRRRSGPSPIKESVSSLMSDEGASLTSRAETAATDFDSKYAKLKGKVETLINMNKKLRSELKVKQKREASEEKKIVEDEKPLDKSLQETLLSPNLINLPDDDPYQSDSMSKVIKPMSRIKAAQIDLSGGKSFKYHLKILLKRNVHVVCHSKA
jgi:hypothetical protein